jgi:deoxyhypusine synthase
MPSVNDVEWTPDQSVSELVDQFGQTGLQATQLRRAAEAIERMYKADATIYLTYTSNMVSSGLRGFFAQLIELGFVDVICTTVGGIEEDIMKAMGERFDIGEFDPDDVDLFEQGVNRIGNITVDNESYENFEDTIRPLLKDLHEEKPRWTPSEFIHAVGQRVNDEKSVLSQAEANDVPVFCPAITDGSLGFHLYLYQQKNDDFIIDVVKDFKHIVEASTHDDQKGVISLGGGVSKHHALLSCLLNGGLDYAVYMTTASTTSGSMSGATTDEAKSWGKIKDDSDAATVHGDVTITFPIVMTKVLDTLRDHDMI